MIIFAVLAIAGVGVAGFLYTRQAAMEEEIGVHRAAALEAARVAQIAVDTNIAVDWAAVWPRINGALVTLRNESDRQSARLRQMEQELEAAAGLQASLQAARADAQRSAQQISEINAQLEAERAASARKIADLENKLSAALKAAEEARARAADVVAEASPPAAAIDAPAASEASPPAEAETAAPSAFDEPADRNEPEAMSSRDARADLPNMYKFPERRSDLLAAAGYDAASGTMIIRLKNGTVIEYPNFPRALYDDFVTAPSFEAFYRTKIMGLYPSIPDDRATIRAHRRR
jgi:hypothetical protein